MAMASRPRPTGIATHPERIQSKAGMQLTADLAEALEDRGLAPDVATSLTQLVELGIARVEDEARDHGADWEHRV